MPLFAKIFLKIREAFVVLLHFVGLGIGYENDSIDSTQNQFTGGVVIHLARHGIELEFGGKSFNGSQIQRQEIEEQGSIGFRRQRHHLAFVLIRNLAMNDLQIGGFTT
jgi:hypothetical protein